MSFLVILCLFDHCLRYACLDRLGDTSWAIGVLFILLDQRFLFECVHLMKCKRLFVID
jgi:hypothetical protein